MNRTQLLNLSALALSDKFIPERSFATIFQYVRIRDRIVIDQALKEKLEDVGASYNIVLVARQIEHAPGIHLVIPGGTVKIVATRYDARGGSVDVSGVQGATGVPGRTGSRGSAGNSTGKNVPGGTGGAGHTGAEGQAGGTIRLLAEQLGDVTLRANGGTGGRGGAGGQGGDGYAGVRQSSHTDGRAGSVGGAGGAAGNGGNGGKAGVIEVEFTAAGVPSPMTIEAGGGASGAAGVPGVGGRSGFDANPSQGARGAAGKTGAPGKAGSPVIEPVGLTKFRTEVKTVLGTKTTADWVAYRLAVAVYLYRRYKPNDQARQGQLKLASAEFDAVLRLVPDHGEALRYSHQIELAQNVLGYAANFDLLPDFEKYFADYKSLASFLHDFYKDGIALLLAAATENTVRAQLNQDLSALYGRKTVVIGDRDAADAGSKAATKVAEHAAKRLSDLNAQIVAASAKAPDDSISIGTIVSTVGLVAAAVVSVAGAVVTGGASLAALVPAIAGLAAQLNEVGNHIFSATKAEMDGVKAKYQAVGKDFDKVMASAKAGVTATVNFVAAIEKLSAAKSANTELVGLMRQGTELAYEVLVANLHSNQAALTFEARKTEIAVTDALAELASARLESTILGEEILRTAGRSAVRAAQKSIDTLLTTAFKAQRAVEIYTFEDASGQVSFDSGFVHPDLEADFDEASADAAADKTDPALANALKLEITRLVGAYAASWQQFLDPIGLQQIFDDYFGSSVPPFVNSQLVKSITDKASLDTFKDRSGDGSRVSLLIDRSDLVEDEFETKIVDVNVALVGATLTNPGLPCDVTHGGIYLSRLRTGADIHQPLTPQFQRELPRLLAFDQNNPPVFAGLTDRRQIQTNHLWGRGVAGTWEISIPGGLLIKHGVDLTGLTAIELWISTQSFVGGK
jgi:hypothetical protein